MAQCEVCGNEVVQGRGRARRTCSPACRQKAHRQRQARQVAELRAAATRPALTLVPPVSAAAVGPVAPATVPAGDDNPAGRIRAAGAELAAVIEHAARQAADWHAEFSTSPETMAGAVQHHVTAVLAAIRASAPEVSRDNPVQPGLPVAGTSAGSSRDEPAATAPVPVTPESPTAVAGPSRDEPAVKKPAPARRKRLTQKVARAIADRSHLVRDERHEGWLLRDNETGTVLGRIEPSYGGTSVSGRNGWTYRVDGSFARTGPYKAHDKAAVQCALSWMRMATAPVRNTITGD